jgi:predicted DNA-binding WGR domain protein
MTLIEQVNLWYQEGTSDKVYEIDLLQVGADQFVVNFRYGRRGAALKIGSKTAAPVDESAARKVFDALIAEKVKGGYQEVSRHRKQGEQPTPSSGNAGPSNSSKLVEMLLLSRGQNPKAAHYWKPSRIIWRIGELRVRDATQPLLDRLAVSTQMEQYCILWALARMGSASALPQIKQLRSQTPSAMVQRIAIWAEWELTPVAERATLANEILQSWDPTLVEALKSGNANTVKSLLQSRLGVTWAWGTVTLLHLMWHDHPEMGTVLKEIIAGMRLKPGPFQALRHLYKLAELREDAEVFGGIAYRLQKGKAYFRMNYWGAFVEGEHVSKPRDEIKKENSRLAYSDKTAAHFWKRPGRFLSRLGKDNSSAFAPMATATLLHYSDASDKGQTRVQLQYEYDHVARKYNHHEVHFGEFAHSLLLNSLLYANSPRFAPQKELKPWKCKPGWKPGDPAPDVREEAHPHLWDARPDLLLQLLIESKCSPVQEFALRAFRNHPQAEALLTTGKLLQLLDSYSAETVKWALQFVEQRFDDAHPALELLSKLLQHPVKDARLLALKLLSRQPSLYVRQTGLMADLVVNRWPDAADGWVLFLHFLAQDVQLKQQVLATAISRLLALQPETPAGEEVAQRGAEVLCTHFMEELSQLDLAIAMDLLRHPLQNVQTLGAIVLSNHSVPPEQLPAGTITGLIQSEVPQVRAAGVRLFGRLSDAMLKGQWETLVSFCLSPHGEMRAAVLPVVQRLAQADADFGQKMAQDLLPWMRRAESSEGLHADLLKLLVQALDSCLGWVDKNLAMDLLFDKRSAARSLGLHVLRRHIPASAISLRQIVSMGSHEDLETRSFAFALYDLDPSRIKAEPREALRILDASWEDSRQRAFAWFGKHFTAQDWTAELMVIVCDSTLPEVQQFGRSLLDQYFKDEYGEQVLLQLSQHPAPLVQAYATHYLEKYASGREDLLPKLEHFFKAILSQVNQGSAAKQRIYAFVETEGKRSVGAAQFVGNLLARHSATMAVADKATCLRIMLALRQAWPSTQLPIETVSPNLQPLKAKRHAV